MELAWVRAKISAVAGVASFVLADEARRPSPQFGCERASAGTRWQCANAAGEELAGWQVGGESAASLSIHPSNERARQATGSENYSSHAVRTRLGVYECGPTRLCSGRPTRFACVT